MPFPPVGTEMAPSAGKTSHSSQCKQKNAIWFRICKADKASPECNVSPTTANSGIEDSEVLEKKTWLSYK